MVAGRLRAGEAIDWPTIPVEIVDRHAQFIPVTTGNEIAGHRITDVIGIVGAETALGMNVFRDFANAIRDTFGGRSKTVQQALKVNRETCIAELKREALYLGANAVVSIALDYFEFSSSAVSGGMLFTAATGTAVRITPQER